MKTTTSGDRLNISISKPNEMRNLLSLEQRREGSSTLVLFLHTVILPFLSSFIPVFFPLKVTWQQCISLHFKSERKKEKRFFFRMKSRNIVCFLLVLLVYFFHFNFCPPFSFFSSKLTKANYWILFVLLSFQVGEDNVVIIRLLLNGEEDATTTTA